MHIGRAVCGVAQRRCLERVLQGDRIDEQPAAPAIGVAAGSDIVEGVVREVPAAVTGGAFGLGGKQREAALRRRADRGIVAPEPTVEGRRP
jgi:hypothetical protein